MNDLASAPAYANAYGVNEEPTQPEQAAARLLDLLREKGGRAPSAKLAAKLLGEGFSRTTVERAKTMLSRSGTVTFRRQGARSNPYMAELVGGAA